jgi:tRNA(Arg) A34 adenosine deaminase TadA
MSNIDIESHKYKKQFMHEATRLAIESVEKGWGGPSGAVIVKDGKVIGRGQNRVLLTGIPVHHAEVTAIIDASLRLNSKALLGSDSYDGVLEMIPRPEGSPDPVPERAKMLKGCELYVNGAPCPMCMSAEPLEMDKSAFYVTLMASFTRSAGPWGRVQRLSQSNPNAAKEARVHPASKLR